MAKISMLDEYNQEHIIDRNDLIDRVSAYGILIQDKKILLVQDSKSKSWEFPGGGLDKNETKEQAVIREFLEETGLSIDPENIKFFKNIQDYFYSNTYNQAWNSLRYFYFVENIGGELLTEGNGDDSNASGFFTKEEIKSLEIKHKILAVIEGVFQQISWV